MAQMRVSVADIVVHFGPSVLGAGGWAAPTIGTSVHQLAKAIGTQSIRAGSP